MIGLTRLTSWYVGMLVTWVKTELFNSQSQYASFKRVYGIVTGLIHIYIYIHTYIHTHKTHTHTHTHTHT